MKEGRKKSRKKGRKEGRKEGNFQGLKGRTVIYRGRKDRIG